MRNAKECAVERRKVGSNDCNHDTTMLLSRNARIGRHTISLLPTTRILQSANHNTSLLELVIRRCESKCDDYAADIERNYALARGLLCISLELRRGSGKEGDSSTGSRNAWYSVR
jgi:hypothetical protein